MLREAITPLFEELAEDEENGYANAAKRYGFKSIEQAEKFLKNTRTESTQ